MHDPLALVLMGLLALAFVAILVASARLERKRREALAAIAARLGLSFTADRDRGLARRYQALRGLHEGENRYAFDLLEGMHSGRRVTVFDFHFETSTTDGKGHRSTSHHYRHLVLVHLDREFPDLFVAPEGIFSKIAQALGYDDIDFESHEFSRKFCVRSKDKKFAYDFCNATMIDLLLGQPSLHLEVKGSVLASLFTGRMEPGTIEQRLDLVCAVRGRIPDYLFASA